MSSETLASSSGSNEFSLGTTVVAESVRSKRNPINPLKSLTLVAAGDSSFLLFNRCINIRAFGLKLNGNFLRELIGLSQQRTHLPHLSFRKRFLKSRHSGKSDSVLYLPEGFANRIICDHVLLIKQLWHVRKHPYRGVRLGLIWQTVTESAFVLINVRSGCQISSAEGREIALGLFRLNPGFPPELRKKCFHWHGRICRGHRSVTRRNIQIQSGG